ncbi:MFS transporter [Puniceibacterium antarcticum]|nr:MFS transporter [Puniceibacterium antarcticum]
MLTDTPVVGKTGKLMSLIKSRDFVLVLMSATILAIPMPMLIILGGLAGLQLAPNDNFSTLPVSIQMLSGLFAVTPMSVFMGRAGRKPGFLVAAGFACLGGALAAYSLISGNFVFLCVAHALLGAAIVSFNLFRFAAADIVATGQQATAISITLGSGLVAALLAPEVFRYSKDLLAPVSLGGAYLSLSVLALIGSIPLSIAKFAPLKPKASVQKSIKNPARLMERPRLIWAMVCGAGSAAGMTLLMTPTPLAMVGCGFSDVQAGDVIRWHVVAMFAPSFFTGAIINRIGANKVVTIGAVLLALSGISALAGVQIFNFYISLILLGVGWNFGFVGSTALLNSELRDQEKALFQGINDTVIALGGTIASFSSGLLIASFSWSAIASVLIVLSVVVAISSLWQARYKATTSFSGE